MAGPGKVVHRAAYHVGRALHHRNGLTLEYFFQNGTLSRKFVHAQSINAAAVCEPASPTAIPYLDPTTFRDEKKSRRVFIETYGCQMNFNDTEIVYGILEKSRLGYVKAEKAEDANIILLMTCAIRERAESRIWQRLDQLRHMERQRREDMVIGVLGCMAERLKTELLEKTKNVDIVCGPDAYRDLPRLLSDAEIGQHGINVLLSADETYADISPIRLDPSKKSAFVSIMRGCNNMCAFCVVPFTRGKERSRPIESILLEVQQLSDQGVKEIVLLGQNVNSYCDRSTEKIEDCASADEPVKMSRGFKSMCKPRSGGYRFVDLLDQVSLIDSNMRIRFTSPHPKDFPDELLFLMRDRPNICKHIHLPAQSGSSTVLERMRRGYTREAYIDLVRQIRETIPAVTISSDFIAGFCGETETEHQDTVSLLKTIDYDMAYMYAYSMREKTMAHRRYTDDVPGSIKQARLQEIIQTFYSGLVNKVARQIDKYELVLVEGPSKKSDAKYCGRTDGNQMVVFRPEQVADMTNGGEKRCPAPGDYVEMKIIGICGATLVADPLCISSISMFAHGRNK